MHNKFPQIMIPCNTVSEMLLYVPFNQLKQLQPQEGFSEFSCCKSFRLYDKINYFYRFIYFNLIP